MELTLNNSFAELSVDEMLDVDGGIDWWSLAGGILAVASGAVWFCGGPGKVAAGLAIGSGICTIISAFND